MAGVLNDFFNSFIRDNLGHNEFWGAYEYLNTVGVESDSTSLEESYLQIQLAHLKILETAKMRDFPMLNDFIVKSPEEFAKLDDLEDMTANGAYAGFVQGINKMLWGNKEANPTRKWVDKYDSLNDEEKKIALEQREAERTALLQDMGRFLNKLMTDRKVKASLAQEYNNRVKDITNSKEYKDEKWQMAEVAGTKLFEEKLGYAVRAGQVFDKMGTMLVQDILATDEAHYRTYVGDLHIVFKVDGVTKGGAVVHTAEQLFNAINRASGHYSIYIQDELSEFLQKAGIIAGQVKSGVDDQHLLNDAKRNAVTLTQIGYEDPGLWELYNLEVPKNSVYGTPWYYKIPPNFGDSKLLEAMANYALSKNIGETAISLNDAYLTKYGVSTASAYMERVRQYLAFSPGVTKIGPSFMSDLRTYTFHSI